MTPDDAGSASEAERVERAEAILGFTFTDRELLRTALTHPSHLATEDAHEHYERLEFLGDSVVGFLMTDFLFRSHPDLSEGRMTKVRSAFVSGRALARAAEAMGLADAVIVGPGAEDIRQQHARSLMADAFEALVAAIYLDAGLEVARDFFFRIVTPDIIAEVIAEAAEDDPKNLLQEHTQAVDGTLPDYRIVDVGGPPHERIFTAEVLVDGAVLGRGVGESKKEAQRAAAQRALDALQTDSPGD